jgi:predicted enzyme related to lactoylglutathione lyase
MVTACQSAGYTVPLGPIQIRPGVEIAMIEDPEGNWVELLQTS